MDFALSDGSATMPQQNMEAKNPKDLWIQDMYIPDSGVVSGSESGLVSEAGTAAPTVYGNYDDLDLLDLVDQGQLNDINQNFEEMQTQDNEALFYDVMDSESKILQTQIAQNENPDYIGPPCQMSTNQDKNQSQENLIPKLIPLLCDDDLVVVYQAAEMIYKLSTKETSKNAILNSPDIVVALIRTITACNDFEIGRVAISTLHNISSDTEACRRAVMSAPEMVPTLIRAMTISNDLEIKRLVAKTILNITSGEEMCQKAVLNFSEVIFQIVPAFVKILSATNDLEIVRAVTATLRNISYYAQGRETIFKCGGIPALVESLGSSSGALVAIHNLLLFKKGSETAICAAGGLPKMVSLLRKDNVKFLTIVTDCLYTMAYGNSSNKQIILNAQGPHELVRILKTYHYEKLIWTTSKVLKVLSACSNNKKAIIEAGGMQALGKHLSYAKVASPRLVQTALWTLRNLSDAATDVEGLQELLQSVVSFLNNSDEHVVTCAAGILCNLTCNNQINKLSICHAGGIDALIRAIAVARDREIITEPAVCALRHLTSRHCESERAQNEVRICYGIEVIMNLLQPSSGWPLIKAVIGLVRNLALSPANQEALREQGAVYHLSNLLKYTYQLQRSKNNGTADGELSGGVRIEEIIEGSVGALHVLARDEQNKEIIRSQEVIPIFVELLLGYNENIQKVACNILSEFG